MPMSDMLCCYALILLCGKPEWLHGGIWCCCHVHSLQWGMLPPDHHDQVASAGRLRLRLLYPPGAHASPPRSLRSLHSPALARPSSCEVEWASSSVSTLSLSKHTKANFTTRTCNRMAQEPNWNRNQNRQNRLSRNQQQNSNWWSYFPGSKTGTAPRNLRRKHSSRKRNHLNCPVPKL